MSLGTRKIKKFLLLSVIILFGSIFCYNYWKNQGEQTERPSGYGKYPGDNANIGPSFDFFTEETEEPDTVEEPEKPVSDKHEIDMELINQEPELPTGCESVALTMVLRYYGFDLKKTDIAQNYLIMSKDDNYVVGFVGNPFSHFGSGCYAPGIADTANLFLTSKNSKLTAVNITGAPLDELMSYVEQDIPVIVWVTSNYKTIYRDDKKQGNPIVYNGITYEWTNEEHCVVLSGFDKSTNTVTIFDSINGKLQMNKDEFYDVYQYMYNMAVVIK